MTTPSNEPSSSSYVRVFSEGVRQSRAIPLLIGALIAVAALVIVSLLAAKAAADVMRADNAKLIEAIKQLPKEIGPLQPPTNDKMFANITRGLGVTENVVATSQVGTTPAAAFATDLTTAQQTDAYTQEVIITNRDATDVLCFKPIAWASAGATCTLKCAAVTITCPATGGAGTTATDGTVTPPGGSWPRRYDGTSCLCIVGSAANTAYQTERVLRRNSRRRLARRRFRIRVTQ